MIWSNVTVLTPGENFDLISLDNVKAFFNVTTTTDDERLQQLITFNSLVIADLCSRVFALEEVEETFGNADWSTTPGTALNLDRWPVRELVSVTVGGSAVAAGDYTVERATGILRYGPYPGGEVVVHYKAGYDLPMEAPPQLSMACIEGIRGSFYYGSRDPMIQAITDNNSGSIRFFPPPGVGRGASGGGNVWRPLTPTATALIQPYQKRSMA